ncbi:ScbA/BarX family gamma-butyrolactone biosynthesis protein (plasmid) [Streptomyces sp. BI20]|uniref:ScbA/BarX family gamma-butyrolactone biosynthesis protein n=1 Tax=Streptomyces sp. BI20 TaxID=3403460 RepID=UPI003C78F128
MNAAVMERHSSLARTGAEARKVERHGGCFRPALASTSVNLSPTSLAMCHRVRREDAFPLGWTRLGEDEFLVRAVWPAGHPFFAPVHGGVHDPMLIAETMRQASMAVIHAGYGVPTDHHFLLSELDYLCHPEGLSVGSSEDAVDLRLTAFDIVRRGGRVTELRVRATFERHGVPVATVSLATRLTSPSTYRRLRGAYTTPVTFIPTSAPLPPASVGRSHPEHVLLSPGPTADTRALRVDTRHPTLFQRPNDHIPGMLLFEAARQAAHESVAPDYFLPAHGDVRFHRYAEFDRPCVLSTTVIPPLEPGAGTVVRVQGEQDGEPVFTCTFVTPQDPAA